MNESLFSDSRPILLMVAGAKGAVGTTLAASTAALKQNPDAILGSMTTGEKFSYLGGPANIQMTGWDDMDDPLVTCLTNHRVLSEPLIAPYVETLEQIVVKPAPPEDMNFEAQVDQVAADIQSFLSPFPEVMPVFVNLLPACEGADLDDCTDITSMTLAMDEYRFPDLAYVLAAIRSGVPVVNFTPNAVENPFICQEALRCGVPLAGRDGKTGQTYLKIVLASALKARSLYVDGWYSTNILGNADGKNLMDPCRAAGKISNKTKLLDGILGYPVGENYGESTHKVHIDYYPPRGDAKEAWDVIDIQGLFGLPMSIRINLLGRDSILAAPMVLDLARWVTALHQSGHAGPIPELGFYFKKPAGIDPPLTFQDQMAALVNLENDCRKKSI